MTRGLFNTCTKGRQISVRCPPKLDAEDHKIVILHCFPLKRERIARGLGNTIESLEVLSCLLFVRSRASVIKTLALVKKGLVRKGGEIQFTKEEQ